MHIHSSRARLAALAGLFMASCSSLPPAHTSRIDGSDIAWVRTGSARTTVVLQSGLGDGMSTWAAVIQRLPPSVASFAYDRPGYGASRPAPPVPRSPCDIARELHATLIVAGAPPPYLLVGHSLGGQYQFAFARLFPKETAGLLLLDPTHPDHWSSLQRETPATAATISALRATVFSSAMRAEFDGQASCLDTAPPLAQTMPIRILASTRSELGESPAFQAVVSRLRADWLSRLPGATMQPVEGAGHYIQRDKPDVVASEVGAMLERIPQAAP